MAPNQGFTLWLTGMSGAGKTTLADYVAARLKQVGRLVEVLDENDIADDLWEVPLTSRRNATWPCGEWVTSPRCCRGTRWRFWWPR